MSYHHWLGEDADEPRCFGVPVININLVESRETRTREALARMAEDIRKVIKRGLA